MTTAVVADELVEVTTPAARRMPSARYGAGPCRSDDGASQHRDGSVSALESATKSIIGIITAHSHNSVVNKLRDSLATKEILTIAKLLHVGLDCRSWRLSGQSGRRVVVLRVRVADRHQLDRRYSYHTITQSTDAFYRATYAGAVYAIAMCLCPSVCYKSEFYRKG